MQTCGSPKIRVVGSRQQLYRRQVSCGLHRCVLLKIYVYICCSEYFSEISSKHRATRLKHQPWHYCAVRCRTYKACGMRLVCLANFSQIESSSCTVARNSVGTRCPNPAWRPLPPASAPELQVLLHGDMSSSRLLFDLRDAIIFHAATVGISIACLGWLCTGARASNRLLACVSGF